MLEDKTTPTFLGMTGGEWEALYGGFRSGLHFWEIRHSTMTDIEKMDIPDYLKKEYLDEFHYYQIGEDLPLYFALIGGAVYLALHGQLDSVVQPIVKFGVSRILAIVTGTAIAI